MISAFLHAGRALGDDEAAHAALESLAILSQRCRTSALLIAHVCRPDLQEKSRVAFLSDQARVIGAMVDAYEYTGDRKHLVEAQGLAERLIALFGDVITGGFSDSTSSPDAPGLLAWPYRDMTENMAAAEALLRLGHLTGRKDLIKSGRRAVESWADEYGSIARHSARYALASQKFLTPPLEVLVVGAERGEQGAKLRAGSLRLYHPWQIVRHSALEPGKAELRAKGLEPLGDSQVAFCIGEDCTGPFTAEADLPRELESFLNPGKAGEGDEGR